jgi:hypothetical protein
MSEAAKEMVKQLESGHTFHVPTPAGEHVQGHPESSVF